jgi:hypothetical protein
MDFGGLKRGFLTKDQDKGKADKGKESESSSDNSRINFSRTLAKAKDAKKPEVAPAEHSQDKAQQRDVASSSDVNKIGDIPENFKLIGGNTDLANAKVIVLGEAHLPQHRKDILNFINTHAKDGDIVLIESVKAYEPITKVKFTELIQNVLGKDDYPELTKNISIHGYDDEEAFEAGKLLIAKDFINVRRLCRMFLNRKENSIEKELFNIRDKKMLEVINNMRNECHDKKIFVIAGKMHFTTESTDFNKETIESAIKESLGTATVSGGGPLIRAQNFGKIEHIHPIVQLYQSLKYEENLNSLILKTITSLALKDLLSLEQQPLTSLIQENLKNQPYIVLERDCVLGPGSSLEKDLEDRFRRVYQLETVSTADALTNLRAQLDSFHAIS